MPGSVSSTNSSTSDTKTMMPPPVGDSQKAEKYVNWIIDLIGKNKLLVSHSDLTKYQPSCLEDHYRVPLKDYEVEVSHSKHPDTSADLYVMLFNNLKFIGSGKTEKVILAFIYLTKDQFLEFKQVADSQITQIQKVAEEHRFKQAMTPIDGLLEQIGANEASLVQEEAGKVLEQAEEDQSEAAQPIEEPAPPTETLAAISDTPEPTPEIEPENKPQPTFPAPDNQPSDQITDEPSQPSAKPTEEETVKTPESEETTPDLPPVPPASLTPTEEPAAQAETPADTSTTSPSPDHLSQLAEAAALAASTPETPSQNVYLTGDLGYQIPEAPPPTPQVDSAPAPITEPPKPAEPVVNSESSSLFQGGQNENNLFINPASLNPADLKPVNPS